VACGENAAVETGLAVMSRFGGRIQIQRCSTCYTVNPQTTKSDPIGIFYRAWLWHAEYRDTLGATVTTDGDAARYAVFRQPGGRRAVVVINQDATQILTAKVELPGAAGNLQLVTPEQPEARPTEGMLKIPPRSAAVVLEP